MEKEVEREGEKEEEEEQQISQNKTFSATTAERETLTNFAKVNSSVSLLSDDSRSDNSRNESITGQIAQLPNCVVIFYVRMAKRHITAHHNNQFICGVLLVFNPNCHGLENVQTAMGGASEAPPKKVSKRM